MALTDTKMTIKIPSLGLKLIGKYNYSNYINRIKEFKKKENTLIEPY